MEAVLRMGAKSVSERAGNGQGVLGVCAVSKGNGIKSRWECTGMVELRQFKSLSDMPVEK